MRILLLSDWMSNRGGAENYILSLRDELRDQGDDVRLLSCGSATTHPVASDMHAYGSDSMAAQTILQIVNPFAASRVRAAVRDFRPDVAIVSQFAYHLSPAIFRALQPVPTAVTMMDYKAICPTGTRLLPDGSLCGVTQGIACRDNGCVGIAHWLRDRPRYSYLQRGLGEASRIMCPSSWMQGQLRAAGVESTLIPLGARPTVGIAGPPAADPVFAYVGRFSREKGVAVLLAAFAQVLPEFPAARLRLIGDGPLRPALAALSEALGVGPSVEFRGWSAPESMRDELDDAWCVVCPSLWAEPFGLAAVESVMLGIPVLASDTGGFRETVADAENGLLFRTGDVASLTSAMSLIAGGKLFPGARLPGDVIGRMSERHGIRAHAERVRVVLSEMLQARVN